MKYLVVEEERNLNEYFRFVVPFYKINFLSITQVLEEHSLLIFISYKKISAEKAPSCSVCNLFLNDISHPKVLTNIVLTYPNLANLFTTG